MSNIVAILAGKCENARGGSHLEANWGHFKAILVPFWGHLDAILGPSLDHLGAILGQLNLAEQGWLVIVVL